MGTLSSPSVLENCNAPGDHGNDSRAKGWMTRLSVFCPSSTGKKPLTSDVSGVPDSRDGLRQIRDTDTTIIHFRWPGPWETALLDTHVHTRPVFRICNFKRISLRSLSESWDLSQKIRRCFVWLSGRSGGEKIRPSTGFRTGGKSALLAEDQVPTRWLWSRVFVSKRVLIEQK